MSRIRIRINVMRIRNTALHYLQTEIESLIHPENNKREATENNELKVKMEYKLRMIKTFLLFS